MIHQPARPIVTQIVRTLAWGACCGLAAGLLGARAVHAQDFPPITDAERALQTVAGEPNAPAVVLFRKAELWMLDDSRQQASSRILVRERRKILTEQGKSEGDVRIAHSNFVRLSNFRGRTVLPDGQVVPLAADARFVDTASRSQRLFVTSVAFPAVTVGAILDFSYELHWDSIFFLEPWFFQDRVPVVLSEITHTIPKRVAVAAWRVDPMGVGIKSESAKVVTGSITVRSWAENLPSVPDEPSGLPFRDMAAQMLMIPTAYSDPYSYQPLLKDWSSTCTLYDSFYSEARSRDGDARNRAEAIAKAAGKDRRAQAEAIYRFVRDEITTEAVAGVGLREHATVAGVLKRKLGDPAEKALLLQVMLQELELEPHLVWAADRSGGLVDLAVPAPSGFDTVLVALDLGTGRIYLDPNDRSLPFGKLQPGYAGTRAVLFDRKKPEGFVLPELEAAENERHATLELTIADSGAVAGQGKLVLTGAHAWLRTHWQPNEAETTRAWKEWLEKNLEDYDVRDVVAREEVETQHVELTWTMALRAEATLPDEVTFAPSRPLGPVRQTDLFPASGRRTPILLPFADRDRVDLRITWPAGWQPTALPESKSLTGTAGAYEAIVEVDAAAHTLTYRRRFDVVHRSAANRDQMIALQALFGSAQKHDGQALVLVQR